MRLIILFIFFTFIFETAQAQVTREWVAGYNGSADSIDQSRSVVTDNSGNIYITGNSFGIGSFADYLTIKYNSEGVLQWEARYNGSGNSYDRASSIAVDGSGNVYVTGESVGKTSYDYATIKYNSSGVVQWVAKYDGPGNSYDIANSIVLDNSGNVYVAGFSIGPGPGADYTTIKYNSAGIQQWIARYNRLGNLYNSFASSIAIDSSDNVYIAGERIDIKTGYDFALIKYNSTGTEQWVRTYSGSGNMDDISTAIEVDGSGNVYITGFSTDSVTNRDYATIKYDPAGTAQWVSKYNGPGDFDDVPIAIVSDDSLNIYVTGYSFNGLKSSDYSTIKYNSAGVQQWVARYTGPGNSFDFPNSIALDASRNVYVTGSSNGIGTSVDYATIKYNSAGAVKWVERFNGPANSYDFAYSIALDNSGNVIVTGMSYSGETGEDYVTIKYSQTTGINQFSSELPEHFRLSQNFPNPFNPVTNIEFQISQWGFVNLKIYDLLGIEVTTLVNTDLSPGSYQIKFDGSKFTSGVYFYRIETGFFIETKKMLLLK